MVVIELSSGGCFARCMAAAADVGVAASSTSGGFLMKLEQRIYCMEGVWDYGAREVEPTVEPLLEMLRRQDQWNYVRRDCATTGELKHAASGIRVGSERVRVEVEPSQMEVDGVAEPLAVAISAGLPLDPLDLGVDAL